MSSDANRIRERLGSRHQIGVRTSRKYLQSAGIEAVPAPRFDSPDEFVVYWKGREAGRVNPGSTMPPDQVVARVLRLCADACVAADVPKPRPVEDRRAIDDYEGEPWPGSTYDGQ